MSNKYRLDLLMNYVEINSSSFTTYSSYYYVDIVFFCLNKVDLLKRCLSMWYFLDEFYKPIIGKSGIFYY